MTSINKELTECVSKINLQRVTWLLEHNADPNYIRQASYFYKGKWCDAYNNDGTEKRDMEPDQPTTPLKLCVFRFSDCMLTEEDLSQLIQIAKVLIQHGAHKTEALEYFISRYGTTFNLDNTNSNDVWSTFYELLN